MPIEVGEAVERPGPEQAVLGLFKGPDDVEGQAVFDRPRLRDVFRGSVVQINGVGRRPGTPISDRGEEVR
jgi:hypothetical protein